MLNPTWTLVDADRTPMGPLTPEDSEMIADLFGTQAAIDAVQTYGVTRA